MTARSLGPVDALLDRLLDPQFAWLQEFGPLSGKPPHDSLHTRKTWLSSESVADLCKEMAEQAWQEGRYAVALRLLLGESRVAKNVGDAKRFAESIAFIAQWHRLSGGLVAAEMWNRQLLAIRVGASAAWLHAHAWRELGAIHTITSRYDQALHYCDQAIAICEQFAGEPNIAGRHVRALLDKVAIERARGRFQTAQSFLREASRLSAEASDVDTFTHGLLWLRVAGNELALGRFDLALQANKEAASRFQGISDQNYQLALLRQVTCMRSLGHLKEGLELIDSLITRSRRVQDGGYRLGQLLLERAEILQAMGDHGSVRETLRQAQPMYESSERLEALRWYRLVARHIISTSGDLEIAAQITGKVLEIASQPERRDLTRTMLGLYDLMRIGPLPSLSRHWFAACRAALVAADIQRNSLDEPDARWSMQAQREALYFGAIGVHIELDREKDAAQVAELGRADVLNTLLAMDPRGRAEVLTEQQIKLPGLGPAIVRGVYTVAQAAAKSIQTRSQPRQILLLPLPGELPSDTELDAMADLVVLSNVGTNGDIWRSHVLIRRRGGVWTTNVREATPEIGNLLARLAAGGHIPQRGVTTAQWHALGDFLLPDPTIWAGTIATPLSVLLSPDPRLWQVPYGALMNGGIHLCDVASVTLTPSLRTTQILLHKVRRERHRDLRMAVSLLDPNLPGYAAEEAELESWPGGHEALASLTDLDRFENAGILYVSGHGSGLGAKSVFGAGDIHLDRLAQLRMPAMVILNGCWSGTAASRYGQDPLSLAVGALLGGANVVVAGTGMINSEASAQVGALMIKIIQQGIPAASALRFAQRQIRKKYPDLGPFDWGGLCVVGIGV